MGHPQVSDAIATRASILSALVSLATRRKGVTFGQLAGRLGYADRRQVLRIRHGALPPFRRFLLLADLAGLPRAVAAILWSWVSIPDSSAHLRGFIGITTPLSRRRKRRDWSAGSEELRRALQNLLHQIPSCQ